jgi:hypothetical protein
MLRTVARPEYLDEAGRLVGRQPVSALFNGWRYVAIGARMVKLPPTTTFNEFLEMLLISDVLTTEWVTEEVAKPPGQQHPITRWLLELREVRAGPPVAVDGSVAQFEPTGSALALLTLAYDVYSVLHCALLPKRIVKRLKHRNEFQGAKYEIAVAGLFVRAGFTIEWIDDRVRKRPEFIATHKATGEKLVVEAKSRHRPGVLGRAGSREVSAIKIDLDHLLRAALHKETDGLPYAIYLDANLPPGAAGTTQPPWIPDVQQMFDERDTPPASADPFVGVTITNFSWHYAADAPVTGPTESLLVLPMNPQVPLRDGRTMRLIYEAALQYGYVPGMFSED